jgi:hypothetical protein
MAHLHTYAPTLFYPNSPESPLGNALSSKKALSSSKTLSSEREIIVDCYDSYPEALG